ncbi:ATP-dependent Clp protease proteolytic subunit [Geobacter sp. SVR]|uniref:ATP-dependent Clp protease proteolytic subunit n=1 Tax=Geobacter sp. SVR TaxID=2495594 RepID=UPI00143EFCC5|nr:ATP-dependent Clp protease proteolytic subunit [Geobacter sp. SVR]BCS54075.1 hypothetical protein GSVR_23830 [Geobacter sp. SVR]GCF87558.1 hypothetical protein GSbR_41580 [Geobacter sp. SVR]
MKYKMFVKACEDCEKGEESVGPLTLQEQIWKAQLENFREIYLNGEINNNVIEKVVAQIQNINRRDDMLETQVLNYGREPITVYINSPGGRVFESFAVVSAIKTSKTPVRTVALGEAMSGGFLILLAGHERYAMPFAWLMYHELGSGSIGKAADVREYSEHLDELQKMITDFVTTNSLITEEALEDCHQRKSDWYMNVVEAMELEVIDGLWPLDLNSAEVPSEDGEAIEEE